MKKVIYGDNLKLKINEAIKLLCEPVKGTLGPKGNNVIIDQAMFSTFITNDGVTIAEAIESDDNIVNCILKLAKESSIKTNEDVGDGTTTTLVLLESIFNKGRELIENGINPMIIKQELENALNTILKLLEKERLEINEKDINLVAFNSSNDHEIASTISSVFKKIKYKEAIEIKEGTTEKTIVNYYNGYSFETLLASPYFKKQKILSFNNPYILLQKKELFDIEEISNYLNIIKEENKSLIIIAEDYSDELINEVLSLYLDHELKIILLKAPMYGIKQEEFWDDLYSILDNKYFNTVNNINIYENLTCISFKKNNSINKRITNLKKELDDSKSDIKEKIAMLENGTAEILVGGKTSLERREKQMRFTDALCAVNTLNSGILIGAGATLLKIAYQLKDDTYGLKILKEALHSPVKQLCYNSGINYDEVLTKYINSNFTIVLNIITNEYETTNNTGIKDPYLVVTNALKNAVSIASLLLTTNSLVINDTIDNKNKNYDDYTY